MLKFEYKFIDSEMKYCCQEGQKTKFHFQTAWKMGHLCEIHLPIAIIHQDIPVPWATERLWQQTQHIYTKKKIDICIEEKKDYQLVKNSKNLTKWWTKKLWNAEKVSNTWTNIVLV